MSELHPSRAELERYLEVGKHVDGDCPEGACERTLRQIMGPIDLPPILPAPVDPGGQSGEQPRAPGDAGCLPVIPGYEILEILGKGGMGVVYKARHLRLGRLVALKTIREDHRDEALVRRILTEATAGAKIQHSNIVQIYEVREHDGLPYLALEFVDGGNLAGNYGEFPPPAPEAARLVEALAQAMDYAHQHGVVHRDLKPANVLLTPDGTPKVCDFGIARRLDEELGLTRTGEMIGTPSYMAPEQTTGNPAKITALVDVYGLGAILYWLLTGQPPFRGTTALETLELVRHSDPTPPWRLQPSVPRDLETICLKCLRKEPVKRYASAAALASDLHRFLRGEPIRGRPVGHLERLVKWCRRRPAAAGLIAVTTLALAGGVVGLSVHDRQIGLALEETLREKQKKAAEARRANLLLHKYALAAADRDRQDNRADRGGR